MLGVWNVDYQMPKVPTFPAKVPTLDDYNFSSPGRFSGFLCKIDNPYIHLRTLEGITENG